MKNLIHGLSGKNTLYVFSSPGKPWPSQPSRLVSPHQCRLQAGPLYHTLYPRPRYQPENTWAYCNDHTIGWHCLNPLSHTNATLAATSKYWKFELLVSWYPGTIIGILRSWWWSPECRDQCLHQHTPEDLLHHQSMHPDQPLLLHTRMICPVWTCNQSEASII